MLPSAPGSEAPRRLARRLGVVGLALLVTVPLTGCASLFGGAALAPNGLRVYDHELRRLLRSGSADSALALLAPELSEEGDELLRLQHEVVAAHYAGDYRRSSEALERALLLAEDRYTKSVTEALLSVLTGDRTLPYDPPAPERALLHYYGALNYLRIGDPEEAAVEARRLAFRLGRIEEEDPSEVTPELRASLWHFTGAVHETAGEHNDAAVAYRRARAVASTETPAGLAAASPPRSPGGSPFGAGTAGPDGTGHVVVVVERGFVAHRVERDLTVLLLPGELDRLRTLEDYDADEEDDPDLDVVRRIAERTFHGGRPARSWRWFGRGSDDEDPILFRIAWPEYAPSASPPGPATVVAARARARPIAVTDLSAAVEAAYRDRRVADLAKALLRAVVREELADAIEDEVSEEDETLGEVAGWAARIGGALLERADTRSWHLLPGRLELFRLELPAGRHEIAALLPLRAGGGHDRLDLGTVEVRPGRVSVVSGRYWR